MKRKLIGNGLLMLSMVLALFSWKSSFASENIRIRVLSSIQSTSVKGDQIRVSIDGKNLDFFDALTFEALQVERKKDKTAFYWRVRPNNQKKPFFLAGQRLSVSGENLKLGNQPLPNRVEFLSPTAMGERFDLLFELEIETYLKGVLPKEMPASWPLEALKAQAVAARSYALARKKEREFFPFDVESTVKDQAFDYKAAHTRTDLAIEQTKSIVLLDENFEIVKSYYHADCGGRTELSSNVWGGEQSFGGVIQSCKHSANSNLRSWSFEISRKSLREKMIEYLGFKNLSHIESIQAASISPSGRVGELIFKFIEGSFSISTQDLREVIGFNNMKSTMFNFEDSLEKVTFQGKGHGHGVGMCQYGAKYLAKEGRTYQEILSRYFPKIKITKLDK